MTKRLMIYLSIVAVLTGVGLVISIIVFGEQGSEVLPEVRLDGAAPQVNETSPIKPLPANALKKASLTDDPEGVKVVSIMGSAQKSNTAGDEWSALSAGEYLMTEDLVKTDANSRVTLRIGEKSKIELAERAELSVGKMSPKDRKFKLLSGRASVDYKEEDNRRLKIENADGSAVAETDEGIFTVLNTGATVAVATKTGSVDLLAGGERVSIAAGQQSASSEGGAPSRPAPIPVDVMLKVVDPGCRVQREKYIVLKGRTSPGAAVIANGTPAEIQPDGQFAVKVPLRVGKNNIVVVTEDAAGNKSQKSFPCVKVDPGAAIKEIDVKWGLPGSREES